MTPDDRQKLLGDELTKSTDALIALCFPGKDQAPKIVGDFLAHLLGRVTSLAASGIVLHEQRITELERQVGGDEQR